MRDNNGKGVMNDFYKVLKRDTPKWQINRYLQQLKQDNKIRFHGNPKINKGLNRGYWILE